jgi:hypothetical protein
MKDRKALRNDLFSLAGVQVVVGAGTLDMQAYVEKNVFITS